MLFYRRLFLGFYCLIQRFFPREKNPHIYATAFMTGAVCFFFFAGSIYFLQYPPGLLETAGIFIFFYIGHHIIFLMNEKYKVITETQPCEDKWIYRSLLYFFVAVSLFMYVSSVVAT